MNNLDIQLQLKRRDFCMAVNLQLPATGVTVIFGHSGSGKTTLLRCIAGLERAEGSLHFNQHKWQDGKHFVPTHQRSLAYVFQEASLFPHLTAKQNMLFACKRAQPAPSSAEEIEQIVQLLGIGHTLHRFPNQLSGGEQQRVAIARALLNKPRLLLMDEPLASLDEQRKQEILPYLEQLKETLDLPIVYVTHSPAEVARLADYLVAMRDGQVLAQGTLAETLSQLDFPLYLGEDAGVVLEGSVVARDEQWHLTCIGVPGGKLWLRDNGEAIGQAVRVRILARDVSLVTQAHDDSSIVNILPCTIDSIGDEKHPALALVRVTLGTSAILARMTRRSVANLNIQPGQQLWAQVKSAALV